MDKDLILQQFAEIERRVAQLIATRNQLASANTELTEKIEQLELELELKSEEERRYFEEKELIRSKIDLLLGRLGEISDVPE